MYGRYALYASVSLAAFGFTYITCPLWAATAAVFKLDKLPGFLSWVHTHDDNIYGAKMRAADYHDDEAIPSSMWRRFKLACWWIWRNPNYGFNANVLGLSVKGTTITEDVVKSTGPHDFTHWTLFDRGGTKYFGYFMNKTYGKKYIKIWLGWQYHPLDGSDRYMLKFAINPFRTV